MATLRILHTTTYRYRAPVLLHPHRLLLRPRESPDLRLRSMSIDVSPRATLGWSLDVAGNATATARFEHPTDHLVIRGASTLTLAAAAWPVFDIAVRAMRYPFRYDDEERLDLGALAVPQPPDADGDLSRWARTFVRGTAIDTLSLLQDLNAGVHGAIAYEPRQDEGTQRPLATLARGRGSCRDLAVLFVESVRTLGLAARIVSGYLHDPGAPADGTAGTVGAGSTHAWAEVYLPDAGWIAFDPTNRRMGGAHLVPVAVGRDIAQVMPVSGSYAGPADAFTTMEVVVDVRAVAD
ncbi:transglutaminase family protein [Luteimonas abyssi]|uniref:transglutaminase family protein n=1 Tax=Luteimonas abyssi TaxID=1247514 RepID=UPI000737B416|nr:transglutaminase family protein [Luteimonas abyssi]